MDLKVIRPPAQLRLRTVKPSRAIKNILCSDLPQPASTPSRPSEESLVSPGCWVPASHQGSLSHASQHLPRKKTHSRLWAWPLSSRAVSSLYLACPLPWVSIPACFEHQLERAGGCSVFPVFLPGFSPLLPSWNLSHFLIDFHTESLVQANRATLQRRWDWGQNLSYANKAGAKFPVDPLCGFLLAPGKAFSLLTGPKVSKRPAPSSTPPHWESCLFALLFQQVHLCHKTRGVQMSDACQLSWG